MIVVRFSFLESFSFSGSADSSLNFAFVVETLTSMCFGIMPTKLSGVGIYVIAYSALIVFSIILYCLI